MATNQICSVLGVSKPVIQALLSWLTDARLVAAVSNAGRVARLMAADGLQGWPHRKRRGRHATPATTPPGVVNLLEHDSPALEPETKWVTDITEIETRQGKLYLCIVLDLYDQRIMSWSIHDRQDRQMVTRAVQMAVRQRQRSDEVILHSDRGSQFLSRDHQGDLVANGLICSMSAVGHCGDNAACKGSLGYSGVSGSIGETAPHLMQHERVCLTT